MEYLSDDNYQLTQKDTLSVHMIKAKNSMDAENQCRTIISNANQEARVLQTNQKSEKGGDLNQK